MVLAHLRAEELRCTGCGQYLDESTGTDWAHVVTDDMTCNGCRAKELHREAAEKAKRKRRPGQLVMVTKKRIDGKGG